MASQDEALELLSRTRVQLRDTLEKIGSDDWAAQSPCTDWTVRDLVNHLVVGEASVRPWIDGTALEVDEALAEESPVEAWAVYASDADAVFARPTAFEAVVDHPTSGTINGELLASFRTTDNLVHAWDIAVAIGAEDTLDPSLVRDVYEQVAPFADVIGTTGGFSPRIDVDDRADTQTKLLAIFGRARQGPIGQRGETQPQPARDPDA